MLKVKLLDMGNPRVLLSTALSPPNLQDIVRTVLQLKEVLLALIKGSCCVSPPEALLLGGDGAELLGERRQSFWGRRGRSFWGETEQSMVQGIMVDEGRSYT